MNSHRSSYSSKTKSSEHVSFVSLFISSVEFFERQSWNITVISNKTNKRHLSNSIDKPKDLTSYALYENQSKAKSGQKTKQNCFQK